VDPTAAGADPAAAGADPAAAGADPAAAGADPAAAGADPTAGAEARADPGPSGCEQVAAVLARLGFEPQAEAEGECVRLHNCPFHALASRHTELICGINQRFIGGLVEGLSATEVEARLAPRPGACCVELRARRRPS
jgi:predicted ArsR family transcriptional regulator